MTEYRMKFGTVFTVALLMCIPFACVVNVTQVEEEPDEALGFGVGFVIGLIAGGAIGFSLAMSMTDDVDVQPHMRLAESNNVTNMLDVASTFTANAQKNYAQIWSMTKEHWIRQAELETYAKWDSGKVYDSTSVMTDSTIYLNDSVLTANAVAQINSFFDELGRTVASWQDPGNGTYNDGKMRIRFNVGTGSMTTDSVWDATLISVADSEDRTSSVYISSIDEGYISADESYEPGYIYNMSGKALTLTDVSDGSTIVLADGINHISTIAGFEDGVYTFTDGTIGGDSISATVGRDDSVRLVSGMVLVCGNDVRYATVSPTQSGYSVLVNDIICNDLSVQLMPSDVPSGDDYTMPGAISLVGMLESYQMLLDRIHWTTVSADNAAHAVWDVYDEADSKNYTVTTLMNSNVYESVVLSEQMNHVLLLSAMEQLASYYGENSDDLSDLKVGLYSSGMDAQFIRGNIEDRFGNVLFEDVIYTPFFQQKDVSIVNGGDHTVSQNTLVAIWSDGMNIIDWYNNGMDTEGYEVVFLDDGCTLTNVQLGVCDENGMRNVTSLSFTVSKVSYIEPGIVDPTDPIDPEESEINWVKLLLIVAGLILFLYGIITGRYGFAIFGVACAVCGFMFGDMIWEYLDKWMSWM